jgi:hypothetical protein
VVTAATLAPLVRRSRHQSADQNHVRQLVFRSRARFWHRRKPGGKRSLGGVQTSFIANQTDAVPHQLL